MMRKLGPEINVPIHVYGPETHMTAVVQLALGIPMPDSMRMESSVVAAEFERLSHESGVRPFSPRAVMSPSMAAAGAGAGRAETPPVAELGAPATPTAVEPGRPSRRTFCYCTPLPSPPSLCCMRWSRSVLRHVLADDAMHRVRPAEPCSPGECHAASCAAEGLFRRVMWVCRWCPAGCPVLLSST